MTAVNIEGVGKVNFPDDYTPEKIKFAIENDIIPRLKAAAPKSKAAEETAAFEAKIKADAAPTKLERFGRGAADITQGIKQGYLNVKDMVTAPSMSDLITGDRESDRYTKEKTEELNRYEKNRGPDAGIDLMRLGGNIAAAAPTLFIPGGQSTILPRILSGAAQGAVASGATFTPQGESKIEQIAMGAGAGGAVPVLLQGGRAAAKTIFDKVMPKTVEPAKIAGEMQIKLQQQGMDWNKLTQEVKDSLIKDAQSSLSSGGTLDDAMLANKALIESVGAKPTRASVTRAPRDWQAEKNLRGIAGVGDDIVKREQENAAALIDYTQKLRAGTGGKTGTALEAGESAIGALKAGDKEKEKAVTGLYDAFRASGAQDSNVPGAKIADMMGKVSDEIGVENIPPAVLNRLKEFGFAGAKQTKVLTVNEADKLNRLINNNNPGNGPASTALGRIKSAVNEALLDVEPSGKEGVEALKTARAAAATRFAEQKAGKGIEAAIGDISPDRFVKKFVMDADVRDVRAMVGELGKSDAGKQAISDVRGHLLDNLLMKATGSTNLDDVAGRAFSGVKFNKALNEIPPEKLHLLFKPDEISSIRSLQKASRLLTEEVPYSDVNYSKTSAALANLLQKIGSTPFIGQLVSPIIGTGKIGMDWVKNAGERKAVAEALLGSAGKSGAKAPMLPHKLEKLAPAGAATVLNRSSEDLDEK